MNYIRNPNMEFLEIDPENLAAYDNESGDTHYIDETGKVILDILKNETTDEYLISQLCKIYSATDQEISGDVHEFLNELIHKKVVICL